MVLFHRRLHQHSRRHLFTKTSNLRRDHRHSRNFTKTSLTLRRTLRKMVAYRVIKGVNSRLLLPIHRQRQRQLSRVIFRPHINTNYNHNLAQQVTELRRHNLTSRHFLMTRYARHLIRAITILQVIGHRRHFNSIRRPVFRAGHFQRSIKGNNNGHFHPYLPINLQHIRFPVLHITNVNTVRYANYLYHDMFIATRPIRTFFSQLISIFTKSTQIHIMSKA